MDVNALDRYLSQSDEDWNADTIAMHADDLEDLCEDDPSKIACIWATIFTKKELETLQAAMQFQNTEERVIISKLVSYIKGFMLSDMEVDYASDTG